MRWTDNGHRLIVKESADGMREVSVTPQIYNTIVTIGPKGEDYHDNNW